MAAASDKTKATRAFYTQIHKELEELAASKENQEHRLQRLEQLARIYAYVSGPPMA